MYSTRDSQWYAVGDVGRILRSVDGTTWESIADDTIAAVVSAGSIQSNQGLPNLIPNQRNKIAISFKNNSIGAAVNGSDASFDNTATVPAVNRLTIGMNAISGQHFNGWIRNIQYFAFATSPAELKQLSTL
jgi:hypothetical protein